MDKWVKGREQPDLFTAADLESSKSIMLYTNAWVTTSCIPDFNSAGKTVMRIILLLMVIFTGTGGTVRAEGLPQNGSDYTMETSYGGAAWSYPAESGQTSANELSSAEDELPSWGEPLYLRFPAAAYNLDGEPYYRTEVFPLSSLFVLLSGGLNPEDQRFIDWQKEVYADIDPDLDLNDEDDKIEFINQLTTSIHEHTTYNQKIHTISHEELESGDKSIINLNFISASITVSYDNNFSTSDIVLNQEGVCRDLALIEHYMLGQQGIESEIYGVNITSSTFKHMVVKIELDKDNLYIADPTNDISMAYDDYFDDDRFSIEYSGWAIVVTGIANIYLESEF